MMYDIDVFNSVISTNSTFTLPEKVISNINILHNLIGVPNKNETVVRKPYRDTADNWKKKEAFKATVVTKLEGVEQIIGDIKKLMNKLTTKNYNDIFNKIVELTDQLLDNKADCIDQVINILVSVSCNNKYYSDLYAKIYMSMTHKDESFVIGKQNIINDYLLELTNIITVDSTVDYDRFCDANKKNEQRRARLLFITHLYKEKGYNTAELINIMTILNQMISNIQKDVHNDKQNIDIINELTEDVNVFVGNMVDCIKTNNEFTFILDNVREYSSCNTTEYPGISSRIRFKYMDMLDLFK
jgi:hypothetical protein